MKKKKILVFGLPGSGKSYFSKILSTYLDSVWINSDKVREEANDWEFTLEARIRQANRMKRLAEDVVQSNKHAIADFVCPTNKTRSEFGPDIVIWMNTISKGRFENTNKIFEKPKKVDFEITDKKGELNAILIAEKISPYKWKNNSPTVQMLGRWQPWHEGHQKLFEEIIVKTGQVNIQVRDVKDWGDNPFDFQTVKSKITKALNSYGDRVKITQVPNITNICYGRSVGYKIEEIVLSEEIQKISATKIREKMRKEGKLP